MKNDDDFYRRNLPHWLPEHCSFFITIRLAHSLPKYILNGIHQEREQLRKKTGSQFVGDQLSSELNLIDKKMFGRYDYWLDRCLEKSPRWLEKDSISSIVSQEILNLDQKRYDLVAFCIMPNHVHFLVDRPNFIEDPLRNHPNEKPFPEMTDILRLIKGRSARLCNLSLGLKGSFWQHESYDHLVRDNHEFNNILNYIINNPVKAQLISSWNLWPRTHVSEKYKALIP